MVAVNSTMLPLGTHAQPFALTDTVSAEKVTLSDFSGQAVLLMFICNHCPYVLHIVEPLVALANAARQSGVAVVAINSNDVDAYPQDGPDQMKVFAAKHGFEFPYLFDQTQDIAKLYTAACTPDFFLFDSQHRLVYRGQFDSARPKNDVLPDGADLRAAITAVSDGKPIASKQIPSISCNIKWRPGNAPDYFV